MIGDPTVADLLQQARQHALNRKRHAGRANKDGLVTSQPHALDPAHTDPAWALDLQENKGVSHEAIVAFLTRYPTIP